MDAFLDVMLAVLGGAIRVGTPFLFVSLGECLTEKSGRINLGLEGVLVFSAMAGFGGAYLTGSPWLGVLAAGCSGALLALIHGLVCSLPRVNDIAMGIALMLLGAGLAFYLGKPADSATGAADPVHRPGRFQRLGRGAGRAEDQRAVSHRRVAGHRHGLGLRQHALGLAGAHGR
jgi:ABC-type uncharacterized transport system permease subunit